MSACHYFPRLLLSDLLINYEIITKTNSNQMQRELCNAWTRMKLLLFRL